MKITLTIPPLIFVPVLAGAANIDQERSRVILTENITLSEQGKHSTLARCLDKSLKSNVGPSRVRALLLPAGRNEGGHYWSERSACDQRSALRWPLFWSERSVCASGANLGRPLFWSERRACAALECWQKQRWALF